MCSQCGCRVRRLSSELITMTSQCARNILSNFAACCFLPGQLNMNACSLIDVSVNEHNTDEVRTVVIPRYTKFGSRFECGLRFLYSPLDTTEGTRVTDTE